MNKILLIAGLVFLLAGCQMFKDYQTGASTPLSTNEVAPSTQGAQVGSVISNTGLPYAVPIGAAVTFLATIFFTWKRGVTIRKTGSPPNVANTQVSVFTTIEQFVANVFAGAFTTVTANPSNVGSIWQRIWKVALATVASGATTAIADPSFASFLGSHPWVAGILGVVPSLIAGLEKGLSNVPVVPTTPTTTTTTATTVTA